MDREEPGYAERRQILYAKKDDRFANARKKTDLISEARELGEGLIDVWDELDDS